MKKWTAVVIIDGHTLKATGDGTEEGTVFEGREDDIAMAKAIIRHGSKVFLGPPRISPHVPASYATPLGLTAAMVGAAPSTAEIWRAPKDVLEYIENYQNKHNWEMKRFSKGGK